MKHAIPFAIRQHGVDGAYISQIRDNQLGRWRHRGAMPDQQIVEYDDLIASVQQGRDQMAADIPGPAGNQKTL